MSTSPDEIKNAIKGAGKADKNAVSKKADQICGRLLKMRSAVNSAMKDDDSKKEIRTILIDVSKTANQKLGPLRQQLTASCSAFQIPSPLLNNFDASFEIEVEAGKSIWVLIDANKFWEEAYADAVSECRDKIAAKFLDEVRKDGEDLVTSLDMWSEVAAESAKGLSDEMKSELDGRVQEFSTSSILAVAKMKNEIEVEGSKKALEYIQKQLKIEKNIIKYKGAKSLIVFIDLGLIAGHIAHMAASFGGTAPLAIIACVRLIGEIGTIAVKAASSLETMGKYIEKEIEVVKKFWVAREADSAKAQANGMEVLSGVLAGLTNLEVPSVKSIKTHLNDYQHKLNILTKSFNDLGFELIRLQRLMIGYSAVLNKYSSRMTPKQKKRVNTLIDGAEAVYLGMSEKAMGGGGKAGRMAKAVTNVEKWNDDVTKLKDVTSNWTKWVSTTTKVLTSAGLGLGNLGGELATLTHELAAKSTELAAAIHEHLSGEVIAELGHKTIELGTEIVSVNLKMMGEAITVLVADAGLANFLDDVAEVK